MADDYRTLNRASWDDRAPPTPRRRTTASSGSPPTPPTSATWSASTCPASVTSPGCAACTCSATSAPTPCRCHRLGARMTGLDFSPASRWTQARSLADAHRRGRRLRPGRRLRRAPTCSAPAGSTWSTPASARCAGCRTSAAGPGWSPACCVPAGGCSSARGTRCCGRSTRPRDGRPAGGRAPVLRAGRAGRLGRGRHLRRAPRSTFTHNITHEWNHGLGEIVTALLDAGMRLTMLRRARQRPVGRAARSAGPRTRPVSGD